jgi:hypothetical protein
MLCFYTNNILTFLNCIFNGIICIGYIFIKNSVKKPQAHYNLLLMLDRTT